MFYILLVIVGVLGFAFFWRKRSVRKQQHSV